MAEIYTSGVWTVKAGEEDEFVEAWKDLVALGAEMPGSETFRLLRDLERPNRFLSFAPWESFDAQQAWREHPEFSKRIERARAHCDDFQTTTYELAAEVS
ncbi:MAG TPA: antibiotic biosynthesis monooxygenase family protein [Gaiellaceae bacterium]|jgi:heme-degrading monooxygenase HmoA